MEYCIGIDLGGTAIKAGLVDEKGNTKDVFQIPTGVEANSTSVVMQNIKDTIIQLRKKNPDVKIKGIGVGIPGIAMDDGTITIFSNIRVFDNYPMRHELESTFQLPAFVDNDANNAATGEFIFGVGKGRKNFILITLGTGIGSGIFINGDIYHGANGCAGETGHMVIVPDGKPCGCGNFGCWETYGSATAMIKEARGVISRGIDTSLKHYYPDGLNAKVIIDEAKGGDPVAYEIFSKTARYIGLGLANLVNNFNPECIVIGGGVSLAGPFLLDKVRFYTSLYSVQAAWKAVEIKLASLGNDAGVLGAAALAFMKLNQTK